MDLFLVFIFTSWKPFTRNMKKIVRECYLFMYMCASTVNRSMLNRTGQRPRVHSRESRCTTRFQSCESLEGMDGGDEHVFRCGNHQRRLCCMCVDHVGHVWSITSWSCDPFWTFPIFVLDRFWKIIFSQ